MFRRLSVYLKEMFPLHQRTIQGIGLFFAVYLMVMFVNDVKQITIGGSEVVGAVTVFGFLLALRIVDEFKDTNTDKSLFAERPLPSGKVTQGDLVWLLVSNVAVISLLNVIFMNNLGFFLLLVGYAMLMSFWFGIRKILQKNLLLTLATHNPVQLLLMFYIISLASYKYQLPLFSVDHWVIGGAFYLSALIWELSRKIRVPKKEDDYVTYSQIFGFSRAIWAVVSICGLQLVLFGWLLLAEAWLAVAMIAVFYGLLITGSQRFIDTKPQTGTYGELAMKYVAGSTAVVLLAAVLLLQARIGWQ